MIVEITDPETSRPVDVGSTSSAGRIRRRGDLREADVIGHDRSRRRDRRGRTAHTSASSPTRTEAHAASETNVSAYANAPPSPASTTPTGPQPRRRDHAAAHRRGRRSAPWTMPGSTLDDVDGITSEQTASLIYDLRLGPAWQGSTFGVGMVTEAVAAIEYGLAEVVVLVAAQAQRVSRPRRDRTVDPPGERVRGAVGNVHRRRVRADRPQAHGGVRHDARTDFRSSRRPSATTASDNPEAVYAGRGPFTPDDITASRMIADPYHLLDCATTSEGGCALVIANVERIDAPRQPVYVLGSGADFNGPSYQHPPAWDLTGRRGTDPNGLVGRHAADVAFAAGRTRAAPTSTCWSSTIRSRSRSSGSWRPSASAPTARAARSSRTGTSRSPAATPSPPTAAPCRSATPAPIRR